MTGHISAALSHEATPYVIFFLFVVVNMIFVPFFTVVKRILGMDRNVDASGGGASPRGMRISVDLQRDGGTRREKVHYDVSRDQMARALMLKEKNAPMEDICRALNSDFDHWDPPHRQAFAQAAGVMIDRFAVLMRNPLMRMAMQRMLQSAGQVTGQVTGQATSATYAPLSRSVRGTETARDEPASGTAAPAATAHFTFDRETIARARQLQKDGAGIEDICRDSNDRYIWWTPDERARYRGALSRAID